MAVIKNTIDPNILGSIGECDSAAEYLAKIKESVYWFFKDLCNTDHRAVGHKEVLWQCQYYKRSYHGDVCLELQAQTNELGSQGRVYGAPGVRLSAKRVCNIRCKL